MSNILSSVLRPETACFFLFDDEKSFSGSNLMGKIVVSLHF
ncbi:hypothetical protein [uncultured Imperialibacter sp.]